MIYSNIKLSTRVETGNCLNVNQMCSSVHASDDRDRVSLCGGQWLDQECMREMEQAFVLNFAMEGKEK